MMKQPFGSAAAEREGDDFRHLFIPDTRDRRVKVVVNENRCPILGRRGTGKTALTMHIQFQVPRTFAECVILDLPTFFGRVTAEVDYVKGTRLNDDVVSLWHVIFWTAVMARLYKSGKVQTPAVSNYLETDRPSGRPKGEHSVIEALVESVRQDGGSLLDSLQRERALERRGYSKALEDVRNCLGQMERPVVMIIDSLDDTPIKTDSMVDTTIALLTASNSELHKDLHIKCFVPTELWAHLKDRIPNVGKFDPYEMRWSPDDLVRLLAFRFNWYLLERENSLAVSHGQVHWEAIADVRAKVWGRLFPTQAQAPNLAFLESTDVLILRHTQLRPRQAISLCNAIAANWEAGPIKRHQITAGIDERVESLATEAVAAYKNIYESTHEMLEFFAGGPAVRDPVSVRAPKEAWFVGYKVGAIGPVSAIERPPGATAFNGYQAAEFEFCHREPVHWTPREEARDEAVAIHPIFHKRLGIRETESTVVGLRGWWSKQPLPIEGRWA